MLSSTDSTNPNETIIVKEGYLDVKYPPGCPERKRWKAWHRRWVTARALDENAVYLQISDYNPTLSQQPSKCPTILWKTEIGQSAKLFRSHSGSRLQKTFGISQPINQEEKNCPKVLIYLAGNDEKQAQLWMEALRNAILPPSPIVQIDEWSPMKYDVSLIDDTNSFNQGLLGTYGYLMTKPDSVCIVHPRFGHVVAEWSLSIVQEGKLIRSDRDSSRSGVVSFALKKVAKAKESQQLCFYSPDAKKLIVELNNTIKLWKTDNNNIQLVSKSEDGLKKEDIENTYTKCATGKDKLCANVSLPRKMYKKRTPPPSPVLKMSSELRNDILNCSISSTFQNSGNLSSSDESDYSPPMSPLRTDFCSDFDSITETPTIQSPQNCVTNNERMSVDDFQSQIINSTNPLHSTINVNDMRRLSKFSIDSHIYADVMASRTLRKYSIGNDTVYEELLDSPIDELQVDDDEELYVPPLPPPRCPAKRPSTLRLEQLSESVQNALVTIQKPSPLQSTPERKSVIWGNPLKGVKKILSKDRKSKSEQSSPVKDTSNENYLKQGKLKRTPTDDSGLCPDDCQHLISVADLPIPFRPTSIERTSSTVLPETSQPVLSFPTNRKHSWSVDCLHLDDLKRKHSCLRHFLEHLESNSNNFDDTPSYCSCPSSNQTNTPLASPEETLKFSRRQSKSLSADIEKHFRDLQSRHPPIKTGLTILSTIADKSPDPMYEYCPMEFVPTSSKKADVTEKEAKTCISRTESQNKRRDHINEYCPMEFTPISSKKTGVNGKANKNRNISQNKSPDHMNEYCPMEFRPISSKNIGANGKETKAFINDITSQKKSPGHMNAYCQMEFVPTSPKKTDINGKETKAFINRTISQDTYYEYIDMDMSNASKNK